MVAFRRHPSSLRKLTFPVLAPKDRSESEKYVKFIVPLMGGLLVAILAVLLLGVAR
jgi:hypothetical protein